jgi:hypothetical protein
MVWSSSPSPSSLSPWSVSLLLLLLLLLLLVLSLLLLSPLSLLLLLLLFPCPHAGLPSWFYALQALAEQSLASPARTSFKPRPCALCTPSAL